MLIGRIRKVGEDQYEVFGVIYESLLEARRALTARKTLKRSRKVKSATAKSIFSQNR